jgi:hypothetical protein
MRARLVAYAIALLVCQGSVLTAAPVALCRGAVAEAGDIDECCKHLAPGQTCPMHHKAHGTSERGALAWTCPCNPSDAALASLIGVSGTLPSPVLVSLRPVRIDAIVPSSPSIQDHTQPPHYPPPRA